MLWRLIATSSAALALGACAMFKPVEKVPTVEVPVPVVQSCVEAKDIPAMPRTHMTPGQNVERLAAGASADVRELQRHAEKLDAMLRACSSTEEERGKP